MVFYPVQHLCSETETRKYATTRGCSKVVVEPQVMLVIKSVPEKRTDQNNDQHCVKPCSEPFLFTLLSLQSALHSVNGYITEQHLHGHMTQFSCHRNSYHVNTLRNSCDFWSVCNCIIILGHLIMACSLYLSLSPYSAEHIYMTGIYPMFFSTEMHDEKRL